MRKETRAEKIEREHKEMLEKLKARFIEGARHLPHNQPKG
jgi:hypothetical protein